MRRSPTLKTLLLALITCASLGASALAEEPAVDPVADKLLRYMGNYLRTADQFTFTVDAVEEEFVENGQKVQYEMRHRVAFRRPNQLSALTEGALGVSRIFYNGVRFSMLHSDADSEELSYSSLKVPATTDECFAYMAEEYGIQIPLGHLLHSDPYALLSKGLTSGAYVGTAKVRGVLTHHLAFQTENVDWQMWVEAGWAPVPRKIVVTYKNDPGTPQFMAYLGEWNFQPYLPDSAFSFWVPPGAVRVPLEKLSPENGGDK